MQLLDKYPTIAATMREMDTSAGSRFADDADIEAALAKFVGPADAAEPPLDYLERELAEFAENHEFAAQWAGLGYDDEGNPPPLSAVAESYLEKLYEF